MATARANGQPETPTPIPPWMITANRAQPARLSPSVLSQYSMRVMPVRKPSWPSLNGRADVGFFDIAKRLADKTWDPSHPA